MLYYIGTSDHHIFSECSKNFLDLPFLIFNLSSFLSVQLTLISENTIFRVHTPQGELGNQGIWEKNILVLKSQGIFHNFTKTGKIV